MNIEIIDMSKSFKQFTLYQDVSLTFKGNQIIALWGCSGSGKTTLLNIMGMIEPIDKGSIYFNNKLTKSNKDKLMIRRNIVGYIFQDYGLMNNETVRDNLKILYKFKHKCDDKAFESTLNTLGLFNILDKPVYQLSGGEKQRVAFARLMLKNPKVILADEPTSSLDDDNKQMIKSLLTNFKQQGKLVIVATHDHDLLDICDQIINIEKIRHHEG